MTVEEENALVRRFCKGDNAAFEELVQEYQNRIYTLALRMTGSEEDAFDVSQDVFLKAYRSLKGFRFESSLGSWLYRMTSNRCIDLLRAKKRRHEESVVSLEDENSGVSLRAGDEGDPQKRYESAELRAAVLKNLDRLPANQKLILILRDVDGLSYQEICRALKLEMGTAKSRIARARAALAELLVKDGTISGRKASKKAKGGEG